MLYTFIESTLASFLIVMSRRRAGAEKSSDNVVVDASKKVLIFPSRHLHLLISLQGSTKPVEETTSENGDSDFMKAAAKKGGL